MHKNIIETIRAERVRQRVTMKELSLAGDVSEKQICNIENGKVTPTLETLEKLAKPLGLRIQVTVKKALIS